jgi:hypothetical protein
MRRFDIAMQDALAVSRLQRLGHWMRDREQIIDGQRAVLLDVFLQSAALEVIHDQKQPRFAGGIDVSAIGYTDDGREIYDAVKKT